MSSKYDDEWWSALEDALASGDRLTVGADQLDDACDHIVGLLTDASTLLEGGSHATATFLAITALEEIAKVHIGMYRRGKESLTRRKDPLFQHGKKLHLAAAPTVTMGGRLPDAIGEDRVRALMNMAATGELSRLRQEAIYVEANASVLTIPIDSVGPELARELLLFGIEAFDDAFVGYTGHTAELESITDGLFDRWKDGLS